MIVSIIWAFSFGLIKTNLTSINPLLVSALRLAFASLVFLPFFKPQKLPRKVSTALVIIGACEFGLMYVFYNFSFQYLKAYEVALFTVFTPIYVAITNNLVEKRWNWGFILSAIIAIVGASIIKMTELEREGLILGFILVQLSNITFAVGQVFYRRVMRSNPLIRDIDAFFLPYMGGLLAAILPAVFMVPWNEIRITPVQWANLAYLGILASGLGFFLWNAGARRTNIGALAVFNNLKIPLSILVSLVVFNESANITLLLIGGVIIGSALLLNEYLQRKPKPALPVIDA